jgi:hypothetical protein
MEQTHIFQILFGLLFFFLLTVGGFVLMNFQRFFGPDPDMPSENSSARAYSKLQAVVVWLHALALTAAFALLLH